MKVDSKEPTGQKRNKIAKKGGKLSKIDLKFSFGGNFLLRNRQFKIWPFFPVYRISGGLQKYFSGESRNLSSDLHLKF